MNNFGERQTRHLQDEILELTDNIHEQGATVEALKLDGDFPYPDNTPVERVVLDCYQHLDNSNFQDLLTIICQQLKLSNPYQSEQAEMLPIQDLDYQSPKQNRLF